MDFRTKVVIVTGANSGIGEDVAINFAKFGANVVLVGRNEKRLKNVVEKIKRNDLPAPLAIVADVSKDASRIIDEVIENFGQINVLVNNAGILANDTASTIDLETFDRVFAINVRAVVELTKLAVPHLEKTKGNVVNISSIAGLHSNQDVTTYSMSKAALDMYTKCASLELAPSGIRVNGVNPGMIETPIFQTIGIEKEKADEFIAKCRQSYPVGRVGEVADTTNAILFLAKEESSFINGVSLRVDGGRALA